MDDDLPDRVTPDLAARAIAHVGAAPAADPAPATRPADPDVTEARLAHLAEAWARVVPPAYGDPRLDQLRGDPWWPDDIVDDLVAWADSPTRNVVLIGPVGSGKTHAAWAMLRRPFGRGLSCAGWAVVDLLDALRPSTPDPLTLSRLRDRDLLLLDDIGAERPTDWTADRLYALIHHRWEHRRPIVATANLAPADLCEHLGARTYSRLIAGALVIEVQCDRDRRKTAG